MLNNTRCYSYKLDINKSAYLRSDIRDILVMLLFFTKQKKLEVQCNWKRRLKTMESEEEKNTLLDLLKRKKKNRKEEMRIMMECSEFQVDKIISFFRASFVI